LDLKEKQTEIEKQNKENRALEYQKGDLSYKLSDASEFKQKFLNLEKETYPLKVKITVPDCTCGKYKSMESSVCFTKAIF